MPSMARKSSSHWTDVIIWGQYKPFSNQWVCSTLKLHLVLPLYPRRTHLQFISVTLCLSIRLFQLHFRQMPVKCPLCFRQHNGIPTYRNTALTIGSVQPYGH